VGTSRAANDEFYGFVWKSGTMTALKGPGGTASEAVAPNSDGTVIVGNSEVAQGVVHAAIWRRQ
jgi:uncharacterized membrane protein